jgi:tetratricopeptide (TPR) repeat protein
MAPLPGRASAARHSWDGLGPGTMQELDAVQDAYEGLCFAKSESLAAQVIAEFPEHPLPRIFFQACLLAEVQEAVAARREDKPLYGRYDAATAEALRLAEARDMANPDAYSKFYLGGSLGARGLVLLYRGRYLAAFNDGKRADQLLRQSLAQDPGLVEAKLGLGQYEYYCGRLSGLLRLVLRLHGDVKKGMALLEDCAAQNSFSSVAAILSLSRIYCLEEVDFAKAYPYVQDGLSRYPGNYASVSYAITEAKGLGLKDPRAQLLLDQVFEMWDQGWRPPSYAPINPEPLRAELAKIYADSGQLPKSQALLKPLPVAICDPCR